MILSFSQESYWVSRETFIRCSSQPVQPNTFVSSHPFSILLSCLQYLSVSRILSSLQHLWVKFFTLFSSPTKRVTSFLFCVPRLARPQNSWWSLQVIKLHIFQFSLYLDLGHVILANKRKNKWKTKCVVSAFIPLLTPTWYTRRSAKAVALVTLLSTGRQHH